jgi:flagellar hook-associated protein 3 FlgL
MAIVPIHLMRVSENMRAFNLLESVRRNQAGLFSLQNQLATGLRISRPSDDPVGAATADAADRQLEQLQQIQRNLLHANNALTEGESSMLDAVNAILDVQHVASEAVGDTIGPEERHSLAVVIDAALDQLVSIGNRRYLNAPLFSGHQGGSQPFELTGDGVLYRGDEGRAFTIVDTDHSQDAFTISGAEFFSTFSTAIHGIADLDPSLSIRTRMSELRGTTGQGVTLGRITVSNGTEETTVDLNGADTVGDVLDKLNAEMPDGLVAALNERGITIGSLQGTPDVTIRDVGGGQTARDLGLRAEGLILAGAGVDLDPQITLRTSLDQLRGGLGLPTTDGLTIRNGSRSATLDFSAAQTVEDVLNIMNQADVGVWARIAADSRSIEVVNRISWSDLTIAENGGQFATLLGIRSLNAGTALAGLNDGRGVQTVAGADLRITTADGTTVEVDLDGATTLGDVIDRLNAQGGGAITAGLIASGNGLTITDNTSGAQTLRVERANLSPALDGLGLDVPVTGNTLVGRDVNPVRVDNGLTALLELRDGLRADETQTIGQAGARLENALRRMQDVQGRLASQARAMAERSTGTEDEVTAARVLLSDVRDVDLTEAVVRFQQMQTALQANLTTSSRVMNLSLIDYLR